MNAKDAISRAKEHLGLFIPSVDGVRVEGVKMTGNSDHWEVIFSYFDDDSSVASALLTRRIRVHKRLEVDANGELISISPTSR